MQEIQKLKCSSCGTMFMSEDNKTLCPSCQEQRNGHTGGGCGCGHSH